MPLWKQGLQMATSKLPRVITPRQHAIVDYAVAGSFMLIGASWWKRNKRAAVGSLICGAATAVNSIVTDYPGGRFRVMTFRNHGRIDTGIAALVAAMPRFMKFKEEPEARFFSILASLETTLAGMTDFGYYEQDSARGHLRD